MKRFSILFPLFILLLNSINTTAQTAPWEFKKEKDGIKVYTQDIPDSNLKGLKITLDVDVSVNTIMSLLMDTESYPKWVYKCSNASVAKINSTLNRVDYYQIDFPWPFSDRDLYTNTVTTIHPETGVITSSSTGVDFGPEVPDFVRVPKHFNQWVITPVSDTKSSIEYFLHSTPGGAIPTWLVNMAIDQGPMKSMKGFLKMVNKSRYAESGDWLLERTNTTTNQK